MTRDLKHRLFKISVYTGLYVLTGIIAASIFFLAPHQSVDFPILRAVIIFFATILLSKYFTYMLVSPFHDFIIAYKDFKYRKQLKSFNPKVSVMIPAWNEECGILDTLITLLQSKYRNVELVIVNDGSTDGSDQLIRNFIEQYESEQKDNPQKIDMVYQYKQNGGKGAALNTAIGLAKGDILMSIDADCVVLPNTIGNFVRYFVDPKVMAAVGNVKVGNTKTLIGVVQQLEFLFSFYFKKGDSVMNSIYIIGGAAGAFRRETIERIGGGYNTKNITEDIELSVRIQDAGMKVVYASDALIYTEGASDLQGLMKQRLRWKRGRFETFLQNKHLFFSTKPHHNKILTWILLPLAWFGEAQLSLELFFITFLYVYSFLINDFSSFISGIIIVGFMFMVQIMFEKDRTKSISFFLLSPIGWLLFYVATYVEFNALSRAIWGLVRKEELKWQKWQRKGVNS